MKQHMKCKELKDDYCKSCRKEYNKEYFNGSVAVNGFQAETSRNGLRTLA